MIYIVYLFSNVVEPEQINVRDDLVFNNVESLGDDVIDLDMTRTAMRITGELGCY